MGVVTTVVTWVVTWQTNTVEIWVATWAVKTSIATWVATWEATWEATWVVETSVVAADPIIMVDGVVGGEATVPGTVDGGEVTTGAGNSPTAWVLPLPLLLVDPHHLLQASDQGDLHQLVWETQDFELDKK